MRTVEDMVKAHLLMKTEILTPDGGNMVLNADKEPIFIKKVV